MLVPYADRYSAGSERSRYDPNRPSLLDAIEAYISTGEGDLHDILDGERFPPVAQRVAQ